MRIDENMMYYSENRTETSTIIIIHPNCGMYLICCHTLPLELEPSTSDTLPSFKQALKTHLSTHNLFPFPPSFELYLVLSTYFSFLATYFILSYLISLLIYVIIQLFYSVFTLLSDIRWMYYYSFWRQWKKGQLYVALSKISCALKNKKRFVKILGHMKGSKVQ